MYYETQVSIKELKELISNCMDKTVTNINLFNKITFVLETVFFLGGNGQLQYTPKKGYTNFVR